MDKIDLKRDKLWHYDEYELGEKVNELVGGYNEIMKRLDYHIKHHNDNK